MINKLKQWVRESIYEMEAQYPETVYKISCMIIDKEICDNTFLPGHMSPKNRAEAAFPLIWGGSNKLVLNCKIYVAEILILNHRIKHHAKTLTEKGSLVVEREKCYQALNAYEYAFTDLEKELMAESTEVWTFEQEDGEESVPDIKKAI